MKALITGVNGQLGYETANALAERGAIVCATGRSKNYTGYPLNDRIQYYSLDITDNNAVDALFSRFCPEALIHCAAWTAVDEAERPDKYSAVNEVNVKGTEHLARQCKKNNAKMLYISTDYVFDGHGTEPWKPDDRHFSPLNVYGQTKLDGEFAVTDNLKESFVVRTAWVFGINGNNFVKTMIQAGKRHDQVRVVDDQIGNPTYAKDLANLLADMIETEKYGYYHATNEGESVSWYEFCREIYHQAKITARIIPVSTEEYGLSAAKRPYNSRLDRSKLTENGFKLLPSWQDALSRYLEELGV